MENKYYIPDISEFYVGFECEVNTIINGWETMVVNLKYPIVTLNSISAAISKGKIRVPYLTKEDIENEGFIFDFDNTYVLNIDLRLKYKLYYNFDTLYTQIKQCILDLDDNTQYKSELFKGFIKNKNEFKKLLTWLKIKQ